MEVRSESNYENTESENYRKHKLAKHLGDEEEIKCEISSGSNEERGATSGEKLNQQLLIIAV